jgi:hypothetical protein
MAAGGVKGMSPAQAAVLEWLAAYPGVKIGWEPGEYASWTMSWADEVARRHMVRTIADLGWSAENSAPRTFHKGGTPRLTTGTFRALVRRGWVRVVDHRPARGVWASQSYWQISLSGAQAIGPHLRLIRGDLAVSA